MGQFQIPYGWAMGKHANFFARTDNVFSSGDTTPDVTNGSLFFSNNTSNTTITHFDLTPVGGNTGGTWHQQFEGKRVIVAFIDDSTRLAQSAQMLLASTNGLQGRNNLSEFIYHNSAWIELSRSYNRSNVISVDSTTWNTVSNTVTHAGTGNINVVGCGPHVIIKMIHETTTPLAIRRLINGEQGQFVTLIAAGGSNSLVIVNSAAEGGFISTSSSGSTQFRIASSGAVSFIRNGDHYHEITPIWSNSSATLSS